MTDQSIQTLTTDVENELFDEIVRSLDQAAITVEEAQSVAKEFLALLPLLDKKDLLGKLYRLSIDHSETKELYLKFAEPIEEDEKQKKFTLISQHIKNGNIEQALAIAKGDLPDGR